MSPCCVASTKVSARRWCSPVSIYAGVPAAVDSFRIARQTFAERTRSGGVSGAEKGTLAVMV
jgi:hypothetical protein